MYGLCNPFGKKAHQGKEDSGSTKNSSGGFHVKCKLDSKRI